MKKIISTALFVIAITTAASAQLYRGKADASSISFFSKSPLEDIDATNKKVTVVIKTTTNDIQFAVPMIGFKFPKPLMEEHFNENYVESSKFPTCTFKGKIVETIDFTKDGEHKVNVKGTLDLHGVTKEIETAGTISIKGTEVHVVSAFKIKVADYGIKVPSLYVQNIAEIVDVKVNAVLEPFTKK
ncbi:MAG: YceI family protein [Bacteroidetes bacterium]|jgi:polyisoprenoid-binding protein YceI|nr:YceI family protein [Bacteroidota bacterium]